MEGVKEGGEGEGGRRREGMEKEVRGGGRREEGGGRRGEGKELGSERREKYSSTHTGH